MDFLFAKEATCATINRLLNYSILFLSKRMYLCNRLILNQMHFRQFPLRKKNPQNDDNKSAWEMMLIYLAIPVKNSPTPLSHSSICIKNRYFIHSLALQKTCFKRVVAADELTRIYLHTAAYAMRKFKKWESTKSLLVYLQSV